MAYIVNKADGNIAAVVNDGTLNNTTSIKLVGIGYADYAETIAEDLVKMLENFAHVVPPSGPLPGQIWFNKNTNHLQVYDGAMFKEINNIAISASEPNRPKLGDFWFDSTKKQLFFYGTNDWQVVAPVYPASMGATELRAEGLTDLEGTVHPAVTLYVDGSRIAIISKDGSYMPIPYIDGFTEINPGINLINYPNYKYTGTVDFASEAHGLVAETDANYMHANADTSTIGTLSVINDGGISIGAFGDIQIQAMVASPYAFGSSITSATDKTLAIVGYGGGTVLLDNATSNIGINKSDPQYNLDVAGAINTDDYVMSQNGYYFSDDSEITSTSDIISIAPGGNVAITADSLLNVTLNGTATVTSDLAINNGNVWIKNGQVIIDEFLPPGGPFPNGHSQPAWPINNNHAATKDYTDRLVETNTLPIGSIIMWYGPSTNVPVGWAICDGTKQTPDLRNKFVMGAGSQAPFNTSGGSNFATFDTVSAGAHTHTGTTSSSGGHDHGAATAGHALVQGEIANHRHTFEDVYALQDDANPPLYDRNGNRVYRYSSWGDDGDNDSGNPASFPSITDAAGDSDPHSHAISSDGIHSHTLNIEQVAGHSHTISNFDNRPSFVALYYIMKVTHSLVEPIRPLGY